MAVISLVTDPDNLWDPEVGIYAGGQSMRSGDENWRHNWRRPVSVDFFADDGKWSRLGQFRIFGGASRGRPQKSFAVSLRGPDSKYGLKFRLFPEQERTLYPGFILRNGGDAWLRTQIRDAMLFELVRGQAPHVDMRAYRPAIVYLNGRFWGLYGIRGRVNKPDLLAANHLPDQKVILKDGGSEMADDNGPFADYIPVSEEGDYHDSLVSVDVESLMDYLSIELYTETPDWPDYNHKAWRVKAEGGTWRWVLFDLDRAFNGKRGYRVSHDPFVKILSRKGGHGLMLKDLIRNRKFVRDLCARINAHMLTSFDPDRIERVAHQMAEMIRPQMQRQITRWRWDWKLDRVFMTMSDWEDYFDGFVQYGRERPAHMLSIMQKRFGYAEPQRTVLTAGEHEHGSITVEGVPVPGGGFAGMVLGGLFLEIRAVPEPGYRFAGWKEHPGLGALFSLESGQTFSDTALFEPVPE